MFQKALAKRREENEGGFTLIELLVVMIIIGLLAAIAIPVFLNQKENAKVSAVKSDLHNAAIYMESAYASSTPSVYPAAGASTPLEAEGFRPSQNVVLTIDASGATGFCLEAVHSGLPTGSQTYSFDTRTAGAGGVPVPGACA